MNVLLITYAALVLNVVCIMLLKAFVDRGEWVCSTCGKPVLGARSLIHKDSHEFLYGHGTATGPIRPSVQGTDDAQEER